MRAFVMPGGNQMGTGYYLLDNPQRVRQYNRTRRDGTKPSGVIDVHTFESFPDWVGEDTGVENAVRYLLNRSDYGSYHSACDSDSTIRLVPWRMEAFHDRFTNKHAVGISIATQAHKWPQAPREWRAKAIRRAAREAARIADEMYDELGIDVPARWLTQAQAHAKVPGFVRHGTSDPGRRSDPWPAGAPEAVLFLDEYRAARTNGRYAGDTPTLTPDLEEDDMYTDEDRKRDIDIQRKLTLLARLAPGQKGIGPQGDLWPKLEAVLNDFPVVATTSKLLGRLRPGKSGVGHQGDLWPLLQTKLHAPSGDVELDVEALAQALADALPPANAEAIARRVVDVLHERTAPKEG